MSYRPLANFFGLGSFLRTRDRTAKACSANALARPATSRRRLTASLAVCDFQELCCASCRIHQPSGCSGVGPALTGTHQTSSAAAEFRAGCAQRRHAALRRPSGSRRNSDRRRARRPGRPRCNLVSGTGRLPDLRSGTSPSAASSTAKTRRPTPTPWYWAPSPRSGSTPSGSTPSSR